MFSNDCRAGMQSSGRNKPEFPRENADANRNWERVSRNLSVTRLGCRPAGDVTGIGAPVPSTLLTC